MKKAILIIAGTTQGLVKGRAVSGIACAILLSLLCSPAMAQWTLTKPNQSTYYTAGYMEIEWTGGSTGSHDIILQQYNGFNWSNVFTIQQYYASSSTGWVLWQIPSGYVGTNYRINVRNNWDWSSVSSGSFAIEDEPPTNVFPSSGNVGIETLNPTRPLHVAGDVRVTGNIRSGDTVVLDTGRRAVMGNGSASTPALRFSAESGIGMYRATTSDLRFSTSGSTRYQLTNGFSRSFLTHRFTDGSASSPSLVFASDTDVGMLRPTTNAIGFSTAGAERLRIDGSGNVGIGISGSSERLAVNGVTKTREAIITKQSGDWPDYVFDLSYELMDLGELEQFVASYHHLPGLPSRDEIIDQGQAIGGIQQQLLKKIEELTLYLVQLKNEQDGLSEEFEEMLLQVQIRQEINIDQ